jgi:hypothetical protein
MLQVASKRFGRAAYPAAFPRPATASSSRMPPSMLAGHFAPVSKAVKAAVTPWRAHPRRPRALEALTTARKFSGLALGQAWTPQRLPLGRIPYCRMKRIWLR